MCFWKFIYTSAQAVQRRIFRLWLKLKIRRARDNAYRGEAMLWGYGLKIAYPDQQVWLGQMQELFLEDCYGVRHLSPSARVVDAGANIGTFAMQVLWRCPAAHVISIEPDPGNLSYLRENVARWMGQQIEVCPVAVGAAVGVGRLNTTRSDSVRISDDGSVEVPVRPLNEFLSGRVDLLKMDIEGSEYPVLQAAGSGLRNVKRVVVEYHQFSGMENTMPECMVTLRNAGFNRFSIHHLRHFSPDKPVQLEHCCLLEGWRSYDC